MDKSIKGTHTEKNLLAALAGESQATNRYTWFSKKAKKEGLEQISGVFAETAQQEKSHAKRFFKYLEGGDVEITATYPTTPIGSTLENLREAAAGEEHEWQELYPDFAKVAEAEGFPQIAKAFTDIAVAEEWHGRRYTELAANLEAGRIFKRDTAVTWLCRKCGYLHEGTEAPHVCPACLHPQGYFEIAPQNW